MTGHAIPTLETERLRLVPPTEAHLPGERAFWIADRSRFVGGPQPEHRVWRILALHLGHWSLRGYGIFCVEEKSTGAHVGMVGLWGPEPWPEAELAYHLYEGSEGKGYAAEAGRAVMDWNFGALGRDRLVSMIDPENAASQAVATRLGGANTGEKFDVNLDGSDLVDIWRYPAPKAAA